MSLATMARLAVAALVLVPLLVGAMVLIVRRVRRRKSEE